jgi:hypothetical protein
MAAQDAAGSNICETELPPMVRLSNGHDVMCHLPQSVMNEMELVIDLA